MDDVELTATVAPTELSRGARVSEWTPGREGEYVQFDAGYSSQRLDLIADEAAQRRSLGRRVHVGDDQGAHRPGEPTCARSDWRAAGSGTMGCVPLLPELPVAVFDSGVGGLTVLHELLVSLPTEDYLYLGDTARLPYGNRSPQELSAFSIEIADYLLQQGAKVLVVACNSASAAALPAVQRHLDEQGAEVDLIGVLRWAAQMAVAASRSGRIGLLATPATVASGAYERTVTAADPHVHLESVACPDLASIIEAGFPFDEHLVETVREYCAPLRRADVDTVILGCTHFPLIAPMLQRTLGRGVTLVTSGPGVARSVERALASRGLLNPRRGEGSYRFRCTGDVGSFHALGTRFLQMPLGEVVHVELGTKVAA
jgi:glutamate racemase